MKLYFVRRKDSGAYLEWKRVAIHWVSTRQEASHYPERRVAECVCEDLTVWNNTPCEIEEIDVDAGREALQILATLYRFKDLGDDVFYIRDMERKGWEGPKVKAWGKACARAEQLVKALPKTAEDYQL